MKATEPSIHAAIAALQRLAELFTVRREQLARDAELTVAQWEVLSEISGEQFMPSLFARRRESTPAAVSKILRQLLDKGLITARISQTDGRQRDYALTAKGRRAIKALRADRRRAIEAIWLDLAPRELDAFTRFADKLIGRMEKHAGQRE